MGNSQAQIEDQSKNYLQMLQEIEEIILNLREDNLDQSIDLTLNLKNAQFLYSFNFIICQIIYTYFVFQNQSVKIFFDYLKLLQTKEDENEERNKIINIFAKLLMYYETQDSYYLLEKLLENNLIDQKIIMNKKSLYFFVYHKSVDNKSKYVTHFLKNYNELSKNDWELHKKLIKEGFNPNEIAKIIRNDEIEKLQEISSRTNFNFNQTIEPSLYERCDFINQYNISLIDYAAFFSAVKCFKYLLMNGAKVNNTGKYAIAGGNEEIIHLCEQNHSSFEDAYETAIQFHRNDIFYYLYDSKTIANRTLEKLEEKCVLYHNYKILSFLIENGIKNYSLCIKGSIESGNIFLMKYFLLEKENPKFNLELILLSRNIEFIIYSLNKKWSEINLYNLVYFNNLVYQTFFEVFFKYFS